jgi:hypothetical protein
MRLIVLILVVGRLRCRRQRLRLTLAWLLFRRQAVVI